MNEVANRVKSLEELLRDRETNLNKKITKTIAIYVVLVGITAAYTLIIVSHLKRQTAPEALSEIAVNLGSQYLTEGRLYAVNRIKEDSEILAKTAVRETIKSIPKIEAPILNSVDVFIKYIDQHLSNELIPAFAAVLKEHEDELRARYQDFTDDEVMLGLSSVLIDVLEIEMDKYINDTLVSEVFELKTKLLDLANPEVGLTKQQFAQRQVLVNWVYLTKHQNFGNSKLLDFTEKVQDEFDFLIDAEEEAILDETGFSTVDGY